LLIFFSFAGNLLVLLLFGLLLVVAKIHGEQNIFHLADMFFPKKMFLDAAFVAAASPL
jgi:hypothetical protein